MDSYKKENQFLTSNGMGVSRKPDESFESLFRRFKRVISKSGIIKEINSKRYHEKDSDKRKRKKSESIKRHKKNNKN